MIIKTSRIIRTEKGESVAYAVKINGLKFPRQWGGYYFPVDGKHETAIKIAMMDYDRHALENFL